MVVTARRKRVKDDVMPPLFFIIDIVHSVVSFSRFSVCFNCDFNAFFFITFSILFCFGRLYIIRLLKLPINVIGEIFDCIFRNYFLEKFGAIHGTYANSEVTIRFLNCVQKRGDKSFGDRFL